MDQKLSSDQGLRDDLEHIADHQVLDALGALRILQHHHAEGTRRTGWCIDGSRVEKLILL